jgi:hypothetical protein
MARAWKIYCGSMLANRHPLFDGFLKFWKLGGKPRIFFTSTQCFMKSGKRAGLPGLFFGVLRGAGLGIQRCEKPAVQSRQKRGTALRWGGSPGKEVTGR